MSVGFSADKTAIDTRAGSLAVQVRNLVERDIPAFKSWLDSHQDAELTALGYSADDVTALRNAFGDLANLAKVATGQQTQPAASNFLFNSDKLAGVN